MEFDATFLIASISFVLFVFIMNAIFYAPILNIMQKRNKIVEDNFKSAQDINKTVKKQEEYHLSELESVRNNSRTTLDAEIKRINAEKSKAVSDYRSELMNNIAIEKENLKNSAIQAKETLNESVVDIAKNISVILLGNSVNSETINTSKIKE